MSTLPDWSTRITDLESKGWSLKAIADVVGLAQSSVSDIKHRSTVEPKGMAAVRLHELHVRVMSEPDPQPEPAANSPEGNPLEAFVSPAAVAAIAAGSPGVRASVEAA